jgi:hypothetical protein
MYQADKRLTLADVTKADLAVALALLAIAHLLIALL